MFYYPPTGKILINHSAIRSYLTNTLFADIITQEQLDYVGVIELPDPIAPPAPEGKMFTLEGFELAENGTWRPVWVLIDAPAPAVPEQVSRRQARQALLLAGLLDQVPEKIATIEDPERRGLAMIEWEDSQVFERHRPLLIEIGAAIGLDATGLDKLFIEAGNL